MSRRLPQGGLIDRGTPVSFRFDGAPYSGFAGDTLASALLANGVRLLGRSFKYHRPRGLLAAGSEEPNALVEVRDGARREPNVPATVVEIHEGLEAWSQNRSPSLRFDLGAWHGLAAPVIGAGFYYKTFMWPARFWERVYEPAIRRAAGLGQAAEDSDPDGYEREVLHTDVLVVGAGRSGLTAALEAARSGAQVVLCDADSRPGGKLLAARDGSGAAWADAAVAELRSLGADVLMRTTVFGAYDGATYGAVERVTDHLPAPAPGPRQRSWRIIAPRCVLATGAVERPPVFPGNDKPGVMLAGAVRTYLNRFAVAPGSRAVVLTAGDDGWRTVEDLAAAGVEVACVVDRRRDVPRAWVDLARCIGAALVAGGRISGTVGRLGLRWVRIADHSGRSRRVQADLLAVSGGWSPAIGLTCHLGSRPVWDEDRQAFVPGSLPPGMSVVGGAGRAVANPAPWLMPGPSAFVDFQHDVTTADVALAYREGFRGVEHLKRYTTLGMATDQGRIGGVNGIALLAALSGRSIRETGITTFRPPYTPVAIGALAGPHRGRDYRPTRLPPSHAWAQAQGAVFIEAGPWLRASYFPQPGEDWLAATDREVAAVRGGAGLCDVSTLGKIELLGPGVGMFLDQLYANTISTLQPGRVRYGLMLREDGFVFDDGTISRLEEGRWVVTTTTAHAHAVLSQMEHAHQVLWPDLDLHFASVTDQWAQFSVAGPRAREVVAAVVDGDVSDAALPYMACAAMTVLGKPGRVFRISFSGERAYEVAVPWQRGEALAQALQAAGATPYGIEALSVMRIEKGHPAGGELNGQTTARDLGMGRMLSTKKDCIGRVMAGRPALIDPERPTLVGLRPEGGERIGAGAHLLPLDAPSTIEHDEGWISSVAHSPSLGWIGLGLLERGPARIGKTVRAYDPIRGRDTKVQVVPPCFLDPEGSRLRG